MESTDSTRKVTENPRDVVVRSLKKDKVRVVPGAAEKKGPGRARPRSPLSRASSEPAVEMER
jgi:hypothetical protein